MSNNLNQNLCIIYNILSLEAHQQKNYHLTTGQAFLTNSLFSMYSCIYIYSRSQRLLNIDFCTWRQNSQSGGQLQMKIILFISICSLLISARGLHTKYKIVHLKRNIYFSILVLSYSKISAISIQYISIHLAKAS